MDIFDTTNHVTSYRVSLGHKVDETTFSCHYREHHFFFVTLLRFSLVRFVALAPSTTRGNFHRHSIDRVQPAPRPASPSISPRQGPPRARRRRPVSFWTPLHQLLQPKIPPRRFLHPLRRLLDAKSGVLVRHHVILVLGVDGLVLGFDVDLVVGKPVFAEVLEEVGVARAMHVDVGVGRVFVLKARVRGSEITHRIERWWL